MQTQKSFWGGDNSKSPTAKPPKHNMAFRYYLWVSIHYSEAK
ncbi:hypothetical protein VCHENC03_1989 [Vibrio sp. HENC-03]|nr:hypothetical protein VCHENC03_1989 [Vibrio sp. HENC-03]